MTKAGGLKKVKIITKSSHEESLEKFESSTYTVFENHKKSLIQHCERSELRLHFEWTKVN